MLDSLARLVDDVGMADDSRALERKLSRATWLLTGVHVVWYWYYLRNDYPEGSFWSPSDWWGFCKTLPGAVTVIVAFAFSIAQCVVMFRVPDDPSKVYKRSGQNQATDETSDTE